MNEQTHKGQTETASLKYVDDQGEEKVDTLEPGCYVALGLVLRVIEMAEFYGFPINRFDRADMDAFENGPETVEPFDAWAIEQEYVDREGNLSKAYVNWSETPEKMDRALKAQADQMASAPMSPDRIESKQTIDGHPWFTATYQSGRTVTYRVVRTPYVVDHFAVEYVMDLADHAETFLNSRLTGPFVFHWMNGEFILSYTCNGEYENDEDDCGRDDCVFCAEGW